MVDFKAVIPSQPHTYRRRRRRLCAIVRGSRRFLVTAAKRCVEAPPKDDDVNIYQSRTLGKHVDCPRRVPAFCRAAVCVSETTLGGSVFWLDWCVFIRGGLQ